jgi:tRNA threonylcarbamoyladenosine biosynthesis protein TsaE
MIHNSLSMNHLARNEKQTFNLGKKLAKTLHGGEVLALTGDLGAGKTVFTKGLAVGLGIKKIITSPTFVLMKVYDSAKRLKLAHLDCYRLSSPQELVDIGILDYLGQKDCVTVIEWAEKIKTLLPKETIWVKFKLGKNSNERIIWIKK